MTIPLQNSIVYGPMESRRFGKSLGINLLPTDQKVCSFDCLYCQYSKTETPKQSVFPSLSQIENEFKDGVGRLKEKNQEITWITIAGNGEPTLYPRFSDAVDLLMGLRDDCAPGIPIGILSNSSTCHREDIRDSLLKLDGRFMKLDAGDTLTHWALNQPVSAAGWKNMIGGLYQLHHIVLQSMFVDGVVDNTSDLVVQDWLRTVDYIKPEAVQVYTIDRPTRHEGVLAVDKERLQVIANQVTTRTGIPAYIYD